MSRILQFILSLFKINGSSRQLKRDGQQVFAGFVAYDWSRQSYSETRKYVNACVDSGFTGITFELMERMADWPRSENVEDVARRMEEQVQKIGIWISECRRAGLWPRYKGLLMLLSALSASVFSGCMHRNPGGRSDVLTTQQYAEDDIYWQAVGIKF